MINRSFLKVTIAGFIGTAGLEEWTSCCLEEGSTGTLQLGPNGGIVEEGFFGWRD